MSERLLKKFRDTFAGQAYLHRNSKLGDEIACELFDDLFALDRCQKFRQHVESGRSVVNAGNARIGHKARRGDGTFGESVPGLAVKKFSDSSVPRGAITGVEICCEIKILNKAMIKQIDRVLGDLSKQVTAFKSGHDTPITVAIVGINCADKTHSYEGERVYATDGKKHKHPVQEADEAERRIIAAIKPVFDELIILRFKATNEAPFDFDWADPAALKLAYTTLLTRVCREYDRRF